MAYPAEIDARTALRFVGDGAHILDVRDPEEWLAGHAIGAQHIPLPTLPITSTPVRSGGRTVVLCRSGNRAKSATELLRSRGVEAYAVDGGMNSWRDAGGSVITDSGAPGRVA